jgi:hypothetical protein
MISWRDEVSGDDAKLYDAVSLVSFLPLNHGELTSANAQTGVFAWKDKAGEPQTASLGPHAIRIVRKR